jgi:hypothetical protein
MTRSRTSIVWVPKKEEFARIVASSSTLTGIAKALGACPQAGTFKIMKRRLAEENIDYSHIPLGLGNNKGRGRLTGAAVPLADVMVEHSTYSRSSLKGRLLKEGILKNECSICGLAGIWNGKPIVMRLDHHNGVYDDHRRGNLRMVCPNCDSQLDTFCSGNRAKHRCKRCKRKICKGSTHCRGCSMKHRERIGDLKTKIQWPPVHEVFALVQETSFVGAGRKLGVTDNAVRKYLNKWSVATIAHETVGPYLVQ